jgi:hypothetical protein
MSTSSVRTTAQIIPFPAGGRKASTRDMQTAPVTDLERQAAAVAAGEAWYHEAAIQDAKRSGER